MDLEFKFHAKPSDGLIKQYQSYLPRQVVAWWKEHGFGTVLNGYLKIVDPTRYDDILRESYTPHQGNPIVIFATGLADLIVWEEGYLIQLDYRHGTTNVLESGFEFFFDDVQDPEMREDDMGAAHYEKALPHRQEPAYDECFGYVPILAAGGPENMLNLRKVKLMEHLALITQLGGGIS